MVPVELAPPPCAYAGAATAIAIATSSTPVKQRFICQPPVGISTRLLKTHENAASTNGPDANVSGWTKPKQECGRGAAFRPCGRADCIRWRDERATASHRSSLACSRGISRQKKAGGAG